jgi:hypothetical protein
VLGLRVDWVLMIQRLGAIGEEMVCVLDGAPEGLSSGSEKKEGMNGG